MSDALEYAPASLLMSEDPEERKAQEAFMATYRFSEGDRVRASGETGPIVVLVSKMPRPAGDEEDGCPRWVADNGRLYAEKYMSSAA